MSEARVARTPAELQDALQSGATDIEVSGELTGMPMVTLPSGVRLRGGTLRFGAKGVRLTRDNLLQDVTIVTEPDEVAILNDTMVTDLGTLTLRNVKAVGQVLLVAADSVRGGHVQVERLTISNADVRGRVDRPRGFGVEALQGSLHAVEPSNRCWRSAHCGTARHRRGNPRDAGARQWRVRRGPRHLGWCSRRWNGAGLDAADR